MRPGRMIEWTLAAGFLAAAAIAQAAQGDVGTPAADFSLPEFGSGGFHTLSQHQGEVVMLFIIGYG